MSTRIARFNILITAAADQVAGVFRKLGEQSASFGGNLISNLTSGAFAFNQITQAMQPFVNLVADAVGELDELGAVSGRLNIDPGFLQTWRLAGQYADASSEQMDKALEVAQRKIGEFKLGIGGGKGFDLLGIGQLDLTGNMQKDIEMMVAKIRAIEDPAKQAAAVTQLFGKQAQDMLGVFDSDVLAQAAADLEAWNGQLSQEQIDAVGEFDTAWIRVTESIKAVRNQIVVALAPALTGIANFVTETVPKWQAAFRFIQIGWTSLIQFMVDGLRKVLGGIDWLLQKVGVDVLEGVNTFLDSFSDELEIKIRELEQQGKQKVTGEAKQAATAIATELAKPEYNPIQAWLDKAALQVMGGQVQQFAAGLGGAMQSALGSGKRLVEAVIGGSGAGAIQAGTVEAAKFQGARVQQDQLSELKAIRKAVEQSGGLQAGLQTGLQIIGMGLL